MEEIGRIVVAYEPLGLTPTFRRVQWSMFACAVLVVFLTGVGLTARYVRGVGWLYAKDESGLVRPNGAVLTQIYLALYAICFMVVIQTYSLQQTPSQGAFIFFLASFAPLVLAFHSTVHATALAPTRALSLPRPLSPSHDGLHRPPSAFSKSGNWLFFGTAAFAPLSIIPSIVLLSNARKEEQGAWRVLVYGLQESPAVASEVYDRYEDVLRAQVHVLRYYRAYTGTWCVWLLVWMLIYIPSSIRLVRSLRSRYRRFLRSWNSLRVLEEMTLNETQRPWAASDSNGPYLQPAQPTHDSLPHLEQDAILHIHLPASSSRSPTEFGSPSDGSYGTASPGASSWGTSWGKKGGQQDGTGQDRRRSLIGLGIGGRVKLPEVRSRVETQVEELEASLTKTRRVLLSVAIQFCLTVSMGLSLLIFNLYLISGSIDRVNCLFLSWTGWTVSLGGLLVTFSFLLFSFSGPPRSPPLPRSPAQPDLHIYDSHDHLPPTSPEDRTHFSRAIVDLQRPELALARSVDFESIRSEKRWGEARSARSVEGAGSWKGGEEGRGSLTKSQRWVPSEWAMARRSEEEVDKGKARSVEEC